MKTTTIRMAFLAATTAALILPAAQAGGLGGALGGAVGGTLGGGFGNSMGTIGGSGNAAGTGHGALDAPDLGRPIGRVRDAGDRLSERGRNAAGSVRDRAATSTQAVKDTKPAAASTIGSSAPTDSAPAARPVPNPSLGADGVLGGTVGGETRRHEAWLDADNAGSAHADRSGADAGLDPTVSAKAGRKAPPAEAAAETTQAP